jgi:epoxyqueuosine reductase
VVVADAFVDELRQVGLAAGLDAVGVASAEPFSSTRALLIERKAAGLHGSLHFTYGDPARATDPVRALPGARALIVGARSYRRHPSRLRSAGPHARVARYAWADHYTPLRAALGQVAVRLEAEGWRTRVLADDNALVDREAATRAGLGWYGKNTNVLLPGRGSWFVLGSVLTDAPLPVATEPVPDGCGSCRRCLPACPTGALVAPGVLDARRCLAALVQAPGAFPLEFRAALGDRLYGCDDCQDVCPPNRAGEREHPAPPADATDEAWVPVLEVLDMSDADLLARFGRWYIPRRQPRYLRRNALVVLGNVGDGAHPEVEAALRRAIAGDDPLVRTHALWAAHRMGRDDLVATALATERDPDVLADVEQWAGTGEQPA